MSTFLRRHGKKAALLLVVAMVVCMVTAIGAFAEDPTPSQTINTAVTTALGTVQTDAMSMIASVLPYALAIVGAIIVVTIGIRVFKRVSGR